MASGWTDARLVCGDFRDHIEGMVASCDSPVVVTDPPFNVGYHYASYRDSMPEDEYWALLKWTFTLCPSVVIHYPESLHRLSLELGEAPEKVCSWVYNANTPRQHRDVAYYRVKPDLTRMTQPYKNPGDRRVMALGGGARLYDWWEVQQVKNVSSDKVAHPCQMPEKVMENVVGVLPDGVTVIDPFMGSGTTGVACAKLGIPFIGCEMDRGYYEIARERVGFEFSQGRLF